MNRVDYRKYAELLERNAELTYEVTNLRKALTDLGVVNVPFTDHEKTCVLNLESRSAESGLIKFSLSVSWKAIFLAIVDAMLMDFDEEAVIKQFISCIGRHIDEEQSRIVDEVQRSGIRNQPATITNWKLIREQLFALGLIEIEPYQKTETGISGTKSIEAKMLRYTVYGRKQFQLLRYSPRSSG